MTKYASILFPVLGVTLLLVSEESLKAQTCSGAGDLQGSYGLIATKLVLAGPAATPPPGTTGQTNPPVPSNTVIGKVVTGSGNDAAFSAAGRIFADGTGALFASATKDGSGQVQVGTYSVNTDCTVSVTISDTFAAAQPSPLPFTPAKANFEGILLNHGTEAELISAGSGVATRVTLVRMGAPQSCSVGDVNGAYAISSGGIDLGAPSSTPAAASSFSIIARVVGDGNGNFVVDQPGLASPLSKRTLTGTYTVNADCTGTAALIDSNKQTWNLGFILQDPSIRTAVGGAQHKTLSFVFTDARFAGSGGFE